MNCQRTSLSQWETRKDSSKVQLQEFMDMIQKIDSCSDVNVNDTESWLEADNDGGYGTITDEEIIVSCSSKNFENKTDEDNNKQMVYLERQEKTTLAVLLIMKRVRNCTACKRYSDAPEA